MPKMFLQPVLVNGDIFTQDKSAVISHGVDLLATTVELLYIGVQPWEIGERLRLNPMTGTSPSRESFIKAEEIKKFFRNKILLRRLKNLHISDFMKDLEILLENTARVSVDKIPILVKLPVFYEESIETEKLIRDYTDIGSDRGLYDTNEVWKFVKKIERNSKSQKANNFYFSNTKNELLRVTVPFREIGNSAWDYVSKKKKIGIKATLPKTRIQGYEFCLYGMPNNYDLFDPR